MKKISPEKKYIIYVAFLLLGVILPVVPYLKGKIFSMPLITAVYWCIIVAIIFFLLPVLYIPKRNSGSRDLVGYGVSGGIIFIALEFVPALFLKKLGASPYDTSPMGILLNIFTIFSAIIAKEMIRQYSFAAACKSIKYKRVVIVIITIIMCLIEINFGKIASTKELKELFIYIAQTVVPIITKNVLLSVFVFYGGVLPSIIYLCIIQLFQKLCPVLPELPWLLESAIGIVFPIIYAMYISEHAFAQGYQSRMSKRDDIIYILSLFASIMFVWFCVGVFPIYPTIILTGSMEPLIIPGDVVLVKKIVKEEEIYTLSEGDIINFKRDNITITHRIKEVFKDEAGNVSFETKGDNNNAVDERKVVPNDVRGIVIKVIPKVGLPILILKGSDNIPKGVVDK